MIEKLAFETIDKLKKTQNIKEIIAVFGDAVGTFGVSAFIICDIPPGKVPGAREIHASGWNAQWQEKYLLRNYAENDPIPNGVNRNVDPYYWREAEREMSANPKAVEIMNEARSEFHMHGGYCVPIHGLSGVAGLVSVATDHIDWKLSEHQDTALHMISIYAYEAVRRLRKTKFPESGGPKLSRREIECLKWVAAGKTTWEIGTILGISENTSRQYIKAAGRKLGTCTRAHLVARAHRLNIID